MISVQGLCQEIFRCHLGYSHISTQQRWAYLPTLWRIACQVLGAHQMTSVGDVLVREGRDHTQPFQSSALHC